MVFRKYRPVKQWGKLDTRIFKEILNARNARRMPAFRVPESLKKLGIQIHNPTNPSFFTELSKCNELKQDFKINHPAFRAPSIEEHPLYHKTNCYLFDGSEPMSDGMAQAGVLSKALIREGFPDMVLHQAAHLEINEDMIRDAILHGERYDPTLEKLPRRFDPVLFWVKHIRVHGTPVIKRNNIILNNLYRQVLLAGLHSGRINEHIRCDHDEPISATISSGPYFGTNPFVLRFQPHLTLQCSTELSAWAGKEDVLDTSNEQITSIAPLSPLIDLNSDHIYNDTAHVTRPDAPLSLHTLLWTREQDQKYSWTSEQNAANAILHIFGAAVTQATRGGVIRNLKDKPVVVKGVQLVNGKLDLVVLQLNTLDLSPENPIKNIVWIEKAAQLYRPKPFYEQLEHVGDINMETVKKLIGLLLIK